MGELEIQSSAGSIKGSAAKLTIRYTGEEGSTLSVSLKRSIVASYGEQSWCGTEFHSVAGICAVS